MTKEKINNINKAIREVITTQFKKDAKESHDFLESLGYKIYKNNGSFWVKNPATDKTVGISNETRLCYGRNSLYTRYYTTRNGYDSHLNHFNFYNCLEVVSNPNWYRTYRRGGINTWYTDKNEIQKRFENNKDTLSHALWSARYYTKEVDEVQKNLTDTIARLQRELVRVTENKVAAQLKLKEIRKELKLAR